MLDPSVRRLALPIFGTSIFRLVLNTARRFAYPFAPALSRGLGVPLASVTSLIAVNQITALAGALIGPLTDRLGYRRMMVLSMLLLAGGMLAAAMVPVYAAVLAALLLAGLGKSIFDPAVQAWAGNRVPYRRRALVIGILEISWSASTLIGIPLVAVLMAHFGWRSPFLVMGLLGLIGAVALLFIIPGDVRRTRDTFSARRYLAAYGQLFLSRPALGALGYAFFISAGNDNLFVVYGAWLETSFGLGLVALGLGTSLIGLAELAGEALTAGLSDRVGLKKAVFCGVVLTSLSYFALPFLAGSAGVAFGGLALLFLIFEFTMVSSLSLFTELLPDLRATMMAGSLAAAGMGRATGAMIGGVVWQHGGMLGTGCVSAVLTLAALGCLSIGLKEWHDIPAQ